MYQYNLLHVRHSPSTIDPMPKIMVSHRVCDSSRLRERAFHVLKTTSGSTFRRYGIFLRRCRPHEPSRKPQGTPSPGAVEAGGHGGGKSKRIQI